MQQLEQHVLIDGLKMWDKKNDDVMATFGNKTIVDDESAKLMLLWQELTYKKKSMSSGVRMSPWLKDLVELIDADESEDDASLVAVSPKKDNETSPCTQLVLRPSPLLSSQSSSKKKPLLRKLGATTSEESGGTIGQSATLFYPGSTTVEECCTCMYDLGKR